MPPLGPASGKGRRAAGGRRGHALVFCAALLAARSVAAHDMWIEPSLFTPAAGARVAVRLRVGQHFEGDPLPRDPARILRFTAITAAGEAPIPGVPGTDPAGLLVAAAPGTTELVYRSGRDSVELEAARFETYLAEEGLEKISALRAQRHESGSGVKELYSRCAKSLLAVGGAATAGFDRVVGMPLELVPERNPYSLAAGATLPLRLLFDGKPLAGAQVAALQRGRVAEQVVARTDAQGRVRLPLARPGLWLIKAVQMRPAPSGSGAQWESFWASLTFELPGLRAAARR
jgi:uncharacterized GH25 family protein